MTLSTVKRAILAMAPLFFIAACEKPTDDLGFQQIIGGNTEADSMHINLVSWTAPVDSIVVALDYSTQVTLGGYNSVRLLGHSESNYFGVEKARIVSQMIPNELNVDFGNNPVVDSVNLYLRLTEAYGDTSKTMDFAVYELSQAFDEDSLYYSNYQPTLANEIGRLNAYQPQPKTNSQFEGELAPALLRIPMDAAYFQSKFADVANGTADEFSSFAKFMEYFKGVQIEAESGGCILYTNLASAYTGLRIYYHNDEDTSYAELNFDQDKSIKPINFSTFEQDYTGSPLETLAQDSVNGEAETYTQAMAGVCTALRFDSHKIDSLVNEGLVINKAEVEIFTAQGSTEPVAPSPKMELRLLEGKSLGDRIIDFQTDGGGGGTLSRGILRNNKYVIDLTRHLFEVLNSKENPTLALVPTTRTTAANRTILRGGSGLSERATVIVYYTKP